VLVPLDHAAARMLTPSQWVLFEIAACPLAQSVAEFVVSDVPPTLRQREERAGWRDRVSPLEERSTPRRRATRSHREGAQIQRKDHREGYPTVDAELQRRRETTPRGLHRGNGPAASSAAVAQNDPSGP
jgi:hypothetical protein